MERPAFGGVSRRGALTLFVLAACSRATPQRETPNSRALLRAGMEHGETPDDELGPAGVELERLATAILERRRAGAASLRAALRTEVFEQQRFEREVEKTDLGFVMLPSVLRGRRGSCVGLGLLALALGELIGLEVKGVLLPGHFFVRVLEAGARHNVELLRRGEEMTDDWYRGRFPIPGGSARAYARPLTHDEVLGVVAYDVGNERRRQGRLEDARRAYEAAVRHFPEFGEAHAGLGAILHLLGALERAEAAYAEARRVHPALPGLAENIELLRSEPRP